MNTQIKITLFLFIMLAITNLPAQVNTELAKKNTFEISGAVSYLSADYITNGENESTQTSIEFAPYGGYFITDGLELGIIPTIEYEKYGNQFGSSSITNFTIYVAPSYNFFTGSIAYPYIQAAIGYNSQSYHTSNVSIQEPTISGLAWKVEGGVKINAFENSLIKLALDYGQKTLESSSHSGKRNGLNSVNFVAGLGIFFK